MTEKRAAARRSSHARAWTLLATGPALAVAVLADEPAVFHHPPDRRVPSSLEPVMRHLAAGNDAFPEEKDAEELAERLGALSALLRESPRRAGDAAGLLLAPDFKGTRLAPAEETSVTRSPLLEVVRAKAVHEPLDLDRWHFGEELSGFVLGMDEVKVAEFLITSIEVKREASPRARTEVRYDLVGSARTAWRIERVGRWRMDWRRDADGTWRVIEWAALQETRSRAARPVFDEVTTAAFGTNASFRQQLAHGLDSWLGRLDAVFMPGGMGHHGVSVGDADGDGRDDLYVAQPSGLPNRLFRNEGDGRFADVTEAAGLAVLDSTSESLFADVDNDGDQDLVLVTRTGLLLFTNDGKGRFAPVADAFRFKGALRGSPTSVALADYDRDGFPDLYLCTYAYFIGASEDKAGTPTPYHDAQNGPPNVLLRNDGHGRFVDVTDEVGLNENNDRFSFAAAWADYDEDGWPDLLVSNDFGRKNLYHNRGLRDGKIRFEDVAARAGVEDYGAGMSAAFLDYDDDGHLDIYAGNMWTAAGLRVTSLPGFKPEAPAEVRDLYKRHARGNSLFRNRGDGTFEDVTLAAGAEMGRWAWSSDAIDFDSDGSLDLYVANGMFTRDPGEEGQDLDSFFWRQVTARSPLDAQRGTPVRRRLARDEPAARGERLAGPARAERVPAERRAGSLRRRVRHGGPRSRPGRPVVRGPRLRPGRRPGRGGDGGPLVAPAPTLPERFRREERVPRPPAHGNPERPRRGGGPGHGHDRRPPSDEGRAGGLGLHLPALEGAALRTGPEPARRNRRDPVAERGHGDPLRPSPRPPDLRGGGK